jgi:lipid II:glycine glycyltransferase (peptidoglycan interpeptide bridge formation enzyme)
MNKYTRRNIRRAECDGVIVRLGAKADIPVFIHLQEIHAIKHRYGSFSKDYYYHLWSALEPGGHFCFFIAEYNGQVLAANSYIAFGDTVLDYHLVDNGLYKELNVPTLLQWNGMVWGKKHGYAWYDFGGIDLSTARAIQNDETLPDNSVGRRAKFKKSFGGQVIFRPGVYDMSYTWPRRLTIRMVPAMIKIKPLLSTLIGGGLSGYIQMHDRAATKSAVKHDDENDGQVNG